MANMEMVHAGGLIEEITEDKIMVLDFFHFFLGDHLGEGASRKVFVYAYDERYVVKLETGDHHANAIEHDLWRRVEQTRWAKWFAPVKSISRCGRVMLQRRCTTGKLTIPDKVPSFYTDMKKENFGMLQGRMVCLDYASHLLSEKGMNARMVKPKWWSLE